MKIALFILSELIVIGILWLVSKTFGIMWAAIIAIPLAIYGRFWGYENLQKIYDWYDRKTGKVHKSGLPMAEWEERQRMKALDEKLTNAHYTNAEKEHLIYTSDLTLENKNLLRYKHIPPHKNEN